jgi:hypothetical protein
MLERFQISILWLEEWWTVTNADDIDFIFVEDSFELGEEIGGRRGRNRAGIVDVSVFHFFSGTLPALGNDVRRCILRGLGEIFVRDHALAFRKAKVMMDKAGGVTIPL